MGDVEADLDRIRQCARSMRKIHDTFSEHANPASGHSATELGSDKLSSAFEEFGSNWDTRRKELIEQLDVLSKITRGAAKAYDEVDTKLADALRDSDKKHNGGKK